jgi:hypothetical protein
VSKRGWGGLFERLGSRTARRAEPRLGIALAGVGMVMIIVGVVVWAGEQAGGDSSEGSEGSTVLGIGLSLVVVAAGYALLVRFRRGPLATAGVVATVIGIPLALGFATFDSTPSATDSFDDSLGLPFSIDAIALVSVLVWLATYAWVPVARGRAFYLAASTFFLWLYVAEKAEPGAATYLITLPINLLYFPLFFSMSEFSDGPQVPDATTIGICSAVFGIGYYALAAVLDRQGRHGGATPFAFAGLVIGAIAIGHLAGDLEAIGTGLVLITAGLVLALYGATQGRRATTWGWAAAAGLGVVVILADILEDTAVGFGVVTILLGTAVIVAAHLLTTRFAEPDEMTPGPSRLTRSSTPPYATYTPTGPGGPAGPTPWTQARPGHPSQPGYPAQPPVGDPPQPPEPEDPNGWRTF